MGLSGLEDKETGSEVNRQGDTVKMMVRDLIHGKSVERDEEEGEDLHSA